MVLPAPPIWKLANYCCRFPLSFFLCAVVDIQCIFMLVEAQTKIDLFTTAKKKLVKIICVRHSILKEKPSMSNSTQKNFKNFKFIHRK